MHLMVRSWNQISLFPIKNRFVNVEFSVAENANRLKTFESMGKCSHVMMYEDNEACLAIDKNIPVAVKLTKTKICKDIQNDDQEYDENQLFERLFTNAEISISICIENFEIRYTTSLRQFSKTVLI